MREANNAVMRKKRHETEEEEEEEEMEKENNVKSTAVVKYAAVQTPAKYSELRSNTNLNLPPANWLRKIRGLGGEAMLQVINRNELTSFQMANDFPDCVGEVDVVSDAENMKTLLKIPYSKGQVSMLIHRIGNTLLMDEFDVHSQLLRATEKDWQWLKKFYRQHVSQLSVKEKGCPRKNKSRYHLQLKSMFSKFLYHSVSDYTQASVAEGNAYSSSPTIVVNPQEIRDSKNYEEGPTDKEYESKFFGGHRFLRDYLWTFEDITMLIGTDMPIFGGGTHPCVSLRLHDNNKPINILTGLDYWLDNLMCNVPEIMMCYHLNGIVQRYELLKTEDIPRQENCNFSPKVIKDVAQNILSFLKSNATKAGHTYWLFKEKDDDIVKLYDLTTLCTEDIMGDKQQNPFAIHVAVLFYTLARNLYKDQYRNKKTWATIHFLLSKCIRLLEDCKTPQLMASAQFLLADLWVPNSSPNGNDVSEDETEEFGAEFVLEESNLCQNEDMDAGELEKSSSACNSSHEVGSLHLSNRNRNEMLTTDNLLVKRKLTKDPMERCRRALDHILKGLMCVKENMENRPSASRSDMDDMQARQARPLNPIPLKYSPLNEPTTSDNWRKNRFDSNSCANCSKRDKCWLSLNHHPQCPQGSISWQVSHKLHLLEKGGFALLLLAEGYFTQERYGTALRYLQMVFMCLEGIETLIASCESFKVNVKLMPGTLGLIGDVHYMMAKFQQNQSIYAEQYKELPQGWDTISACKPKDELYCNYKSFWQVNTCVEEHLEISIHCYEEALAEKVDDADRFHKRLGNALNDLGVTYMNKGQVLFEQTDSAIMEVRKLCRKSSECLQGGVDALNRIQDETNVALLKNNLGRLMRLCAHCEVPKSENGRKEFSMQEKRYFQKAFSYYADALAILKDDESNAPIREAIKWDYSTALFTMATLLQDYAPLSTRSQEDVEEEVTTLLTRALEFCDSDDTNPRQPVCQYRAAAIHHRLASLYHHSIRNQMVDDVQKHKKLRLLAEDHYEKAANLFELLEHPVDCLKVQLEHVGLNEFILKDKSNGASRNKLLHHILQLLLKTETSLSAIIVSNNSKDDEQCKKNYEETTKWVIILESRLQAVLLSLVKQHKCNATKLERYKKFYAISLNSSQGNEIQSVLLTLKRLKAALAESNVIPLPAKPT